MKKRILISMLLGISLLVGGFGLASAKTSKKVDANQTVEKTEKEVKKNKTKAEKEVKKSKTKAEKDAVTKKIDVKNDETLDKTEKVKNKSHKKMTENIDKTNTKSEKIKDKTSKKAEKFTGKPININTATQAELETLPGVGEKTAQAIIERRKTAKFKSIDEIDSVKGIGDVKTQNLRSMITVD